jgi:phosphoenolpyruvate-protein kinase (PTS system EI component)
MSSRSAQIQGMAYVPGQATGVVRRGHHPAAPDAILILRESELAPFETGPAGIIVMDGAPFSHTVIALLGQGRPTVIVAARDAAMLRDGETVTMDGGTGLVRTGPAVGTGRVPPAPTPGEPVRTRDGTGVHLRASVRGSAAARRAVSFGAAAIGLVRTEFLMPEDGRVPDLAYYREALGRLCAAAHPLPVTLRLLDLAPDKLPSWLPASPGMTSALGLQGARLFDLEPVRSAFHAQLAAVAALRKHHTLRLIVPYLTRYEELRHWLGVIRRRVSGPVEIGAMVETPAAALDIASWLATADFIAVGCNDLMQCLFAADRDQGALRAYLDPYAPVLYRLLAQMASAAGANLERVQLCGLLAQLRGVLPVLLGLGFRAFSVDAYSIPYLAEVVERTTIPQAQGLTAAVCAARESREVLDLLGIPPGPAAALP